jgi:hypothetical protein
MPSLSSRAAGGLAVLDQALEAPAIHPAYDTLCDIAADLGWPRAFKDDLIVHDRHLLTEYPQGEFIWQVRPTGTDLGRVASPYDWYGTCLRAAHANYLYGEEHRWFHITDTDVKPIDRMAIGDVFANAWSQTQTVRAADLRPYQMARINEQTALVVAVAPGLSTTLAIRFIQDAAHPADGIIHRTTLAGSQDVTVYKHPAA